MISLTYKKKTKQISQNKTKHLLPHPLRKNPQKTKQQKTKQIKPIKILFSLPTILKLDQKYIFIEFS